MALSGSYNFSRNARELITFALQKANVVGLGQSISADEMEDGRIALNMMLKGWQMKGPHLWKTTEGSVTMTNATQSYNLFSTLNPLRILDIRYRDTNSKDLPMEDMTRTEYFRLPDKSSAGIPTTWYFDPQRGAPTLYVWPVKATITTETLRVTHQKRFDDIDDVDDDIDVEDWGLETVAFNLTARLLDDHGIEGEVASRIIARAEMLLAEAEDYDREDTVQFCPAEY